MRAPAIAAALVLAACAGPAAEVIPMPDGRAALPPAGWLEFCHSTADDPACRLSLDQVNRQVNAAHDYRAEPGDDWRVMAPGEAGDCEDFALTKRARLLAAGWPPAGLRLATCRLADGTGHALLTVDLAGGTLVLDVREDAVRDWRDTGCAWRRRQTTAGGWATIGRERRGMKRPIMTVVDGWP